MTIDLAAVRSWVMEGGMVARQHFNNVRRHRKADSSWVTEADVLIEQLLVERIAAHYPNHGIIGEEQTRHELDREFLWAIDPIDGTGSFVNGLPTWGVSIGVLRDGQPYAGVLYFPLMDDCYWSEPGSGAFLNDQPIHVSDPQEWDSEDWISVPSDAHRQFVIDFPGKTRALGCTIATLAYVARGSAVGGLITRSALWDVAAGLAILDAAGGVALTPDGQPLNTITLLDGSPITTSVVVAAPRQVAALRRVIREEDRTLL